MPSRPVAALVMPAVNCMNALLPFAKPGAFNHERRAAGIARGALSGDSVNAGRGPGRRREWGCKSGLHTTDALNLKYRQAARPKRAVGRGAQPQAILVTGRKRLAEERT